MYVDGASTTAGNKESVGAGEQLELDQLDADGATRRSTEQHAALPPATAGHRGHSLRWPMVVGGALVGVGVGVLVGVPVGMKFEQSELWSWCTDWRFW